MNIDEVKDNMPCPLYQLFCITNQIQCSESVEPWYGQIKELADGADKWRPEMHHAVIYGMYPVLEAASKDFFRRYEAIYRKYESNPHKDEKKMGKVLKMVSLLVGKKYGLREGYYFDKLTDEQLQRVMHRKDIEIKNMSYKVAATLVDSLHIVMQGLIEELTPNECEDLIKDFDYANDFFKFEKKKCFKHMEFLRKKLPEAYSIYKQIKKSLKTAQIKDCYQIIDNKNYKQFIQTLGDFEYKGKKYNLLDKVRPITLKLNTFGLIKENRMV